ncbi:MAG: iron-sulfur cluster assembly scaffold protein [Bryobacterales bacterium]|nr:iron-sulfur cluster assembly scaffold protein [Bryobacterales bacterium]
MAIARRFGVYDLFQQALRRGRVMRGTMGPLVEEEGVCARYCLECESGTVVSAEYQCTTCVTLVAFCEHLRQWAPGHTIEEAAALQYEELLALFPEVPPGHRGRARLALRALQAAFPL